MYNITFLYDNDVELQKFREIQSKLDEVVLKHPSSFLLVDVHSSKNKNIVRSVKFKWSCKGTPFILIEKKNKNGLHPVKVFYGEVDSNAIDTFYTYVLTNLVQ